MVVLFIVGYTAIALEHPLRIDKAASALFLGAVIWSLFALGAANILDLGFSPSWKEVKEIAAQITEHIKPGIDDSSYTSLGWADKVQMSHEPMHFVKYELGHHLIEISEILFFLFGAMTIVEIIDQHNGFKIITDKITTTKAVNLLWIIGFISFFMSAALDNLTTTIVIIALLRKIIADKKTRWLFASIVVLAANAGGAWSPVGDVTTIMLWIGGQVTAGNIILHLIIPSLMTIIIPLAILSFRIKGNIEKPEIKGDEKDYTSASERRYILILGLASLLFVPVFKSVTHLPPYIGMILGLSIMWITTEIIHRKKNPELLKKLVVIQILKRVETPTIFFFLGILLAVAALQTAGHLFLLSEWLNSSTNQNIYVINSSIGLLSSIVDNVPMVASAMGMYSIADPGSVGFMSNFVQDGTFWHLLVYCAGTGGSILIIGSAAGVAAMGLEKIDFIWYLKKISLLALIGYIAGIGTFILQEMII